MVSAGLVNMCVLLMDGTRDGGMSAVSVQLLMAAAVEALGESHKITREQLLETAIDSC